MTQQTPGPGRVAQVDRTDAGPVGKRDVRPVQSSPVTARLADIAAQAGVSEATVSRVLNGKPGVAADHPRIRARRPRRARLRAPRPAAAAQRGPGRPDHPGAGEPDLPGPRPGHRPGPDPAGLHPGARHPDARRLHRGRADRDARRPRASPASSSSPGCTPTPPPTCSATSGCAARACRSSSSTASPPKVQAPFVSPDDRAAMRLAVTHLVSLGHTRIGLALGPEALRAGAAQDRGLPCARCRSSSAWRRTRRERADPALALHAGGRPGRRRRADRPGLHGGGVRQRHDGARRDPGGPAARAWRCRGTSRWSASTTPRSSPSPIRR